MGTRPKNIEEIRKIGIASAFENQSSYFVLVGAEDDLEDGSILPIYEVDKGSGEIIGSVGTAEIALDYEVRNELDSKNPKIIRKVDPQTINF